MPVSSGQLVNISPAPGRIPKPPAIKDRVFASILRLDQERTDRDHVTIAISSAAFGQSTVGGRLLADSPQGKPGTTTSADSDCTPAGCDIAEASRHVAPQFGKDGGVCGCLEKSGNLHRGRNSNNEAVVDRNDHTRNSTAAAPFECPAYGFLWIRLSVDVGRQSRRRERQRLRFGAAHILFCQRSLGTVSDQRQVHRVKRSFHRCIRNKPRLRRERWMAAGVHYGIAERIKITPKIFMARGIRGLPAIVERRSLGGVFVALAADETDLDQADCKRFMIRCWQICISNRRPTAIGDERHQFRYQRFSFLWLRLRFQRLRGGTGHRHRPRCAILIKPRTAKQKYNACHSTDRWQEPTLSCRVFRNETIHSARQLSGPCLPFRAWCRRFVRRSGAGIQ